MLPLRRVQVSGTVQASPAAQPHSAQPEEQATAAGEGGEGENPKQALLPPPTATSRGLQGGINVSISFLKLKCLEKPKKSKGCFLPKAEGSCRPLRRGKGPRQLPGILERASEPTSLPPEIRIRLLYKNLIYTRISLWGTLR